MQSRNFYQGINNLRALVAVWVMLGHYELILYFLRPFPSVLNLLKYFDPVGIFFLISGFLIPMSLNAYGSKEFLIRRFFRIAPVVLTVALLHYALINSNFSSFINTIFLTFDLTKISPQVSVFWSLSIEIYFYIILAVAFYLMRNDLLQSLIIAIIMSLLLFFIVYIIRDPYYMSVVSRYTSLLSFIFIGSCIYEYNQTDNKIKWWITMTFIILVLFISMYFLHGYSTHLLFGNKFDSEYPEGVFIISEVNEFRLGLLTYIYSKFIAVFIFLFALIFFTLKSKILNFLADISYSVYLVHLTVFYFITSFEFQQNRIYLALIATIVTLAVSWLIFKYIEKPLNIYAKNRNTNA